MRTGLTHEAKQRLWKQVDRIATSWEPAYAKAAVAQFRRDHKELLKRMRAVPRLGGVAEMLGGGVCPQVKAEVKQQIDWQTIERTWQDYFEEAGEEAWRETFVPLVSGTIQDQGEALAVTFGMQFSVENVIATQSFADYMIEFAQPVNRTTNDDVTSMLAQASSEGWSIPDMENALDILFDKYINGGGLTAEELVWFTDRKPRWRRELIARTESLRAANFGSHETCKSWNVELKEWLATSDARTRSSHLSAWAKYSEGGSPGPIPIDEPFRVDGAELMYPGDSSLGAPAETVCNCRCTSIPFFREFPSDQAEIGTTQSLIDELLAELGV